MMRWTMDDFPTLREFCRQHDIDYIFEYDEKYYKVRFRFTSNGSCYVKLYDGDDLAMRWLPSVEKDLINEISNRFHIYDAREVVRHRHVIEPWMFFDKELINTAVNTRKDEDDKMKRKEMIALPMGLGKCDMVSIKKVIFNKPATIVIWNDNVKTVVKAENEPYDPEKGLAMAICKRAFGSEGNYYDNFKKWLPKEEEKKEPEVVGVIESMENTENGLLVKGKLTKDLSFNFTNTTNGPDINEQLGILGK